MFAQARMSKATSKPTCKALLLCDTAIVEAGTGKLSLIGTFNRFTLQEFPGVTTPFSAYLQLTNGRGQYEIAVDVEDLSTGNVFAKCFGLTIDMENPLVVAVVVIPSPPLPIGHAGKYDFIVLANNEEIDRQQFQVVLGGQK